MTHDAAAATRFRPLTEEPRGICVFAPWPMFTVTIEQHATGADDVYFHGGGQAVWIARMVAGLGGHPTLVGPFGGETRALLEALIAAEGIELRCVPVKGSNAGYVDDRRGGERERVATVPPYCLDRHEVDDLYNATLAESLRCGTTVLTGLPTEQVIPTDFFHRLVADLGANGVKIVADVAGPVLEAIEGGLTLLKVSHEELQEAGLAAGDDEAALFRAMDELRDKAENVVVSRAGAGSLARFGDRHFEATGPTIHSRDHTGAGDSMTAAVARASAAGLHAADALRLATAAGARTGRRGGRGTGRLADIEVLAERIDIREVRQ